MSNKKKLILASITILLLLLIALLVYSNRDKSTVPSTDNSTTETSQDNKAADKESQDPNPTVNPNQPANTPAPPPAPAAPTISLTGKQQAGQVVQVSAIVKNLTAGTCQATFTGPQGTQPIGRTSPVINKGNFYGCTDMNIPVADFPKSGTWHMTIFAANQNNKSNIAEADIQVTK